MPSISIILPAYNGIKYIREAIDSVLAQNESDWELIVGDDGSSDGTREYLSSLTDSRIKVHFREQDRGIFQNLNFLFRQARSPIAQLLCQDDYFLSKTAVGAIVSKWRGLPDEVGALRVNWGSDVGACRLRAYANEALPTDVTPEAADLSFFLFGCIAGNLSNVSLRTQLVEQTGWFSESLPYAGDFEFWNRLCRRTTMRLDRDRLLFIRHHPEQASATLNRRGELLAQLNAVVTPMYARLAGQGHSAALLRLHATLNYDTLQRDLAIRALVQRRDASFLRVLELHSVKPDYSLGRLSRWALWLFTLGGRRFRDTVAKRVVKDSLQLVRT